MLQKHYQRLGFKKGDSKDHIKKAYRRKAKLFHPDRNNHPSAEQRFIDLNLSYEILMDYKEGGAPTYQTTTNSESYKKTTFYQNTKFTIAEMEAAWERQRTKERKEYEEYLNRPWYTKLGLDFTTNFYIIFISLTLFLGYTFQDTLRTLSETILTFIIIGYLIILFSLYFLAIMLRDND